MNHRTAWSTEKMAPSREQSLGSETSVAAPSKTKPTHKGVSMTKGEIDHDVLIVASKLKAYIKAKSEMNTSGDVLEKLSDLVRNAADDAIVRTRQTGRKTVMARDFA